ncbi:V-set and immunoglobulin domain-containing protein 10-like [Sphaeramia orbicularis]|uniref:V-set and immunoglobulin domain containing 10 like n=1 Tax=Sphaeramia orbicularis TaxID=375764 RepID=A0A673BVM6_9TELE|nr:V-set and immunoglobulin domain-containing protein 10-like [Sphaeramia orbicularis]
MTWLRLSQHVRTLYRTVVLCVLCQVAHSDLVVSPAGLTQINILAGSTVTLAVSYSGATNPAIVWKMGSVPVVTWTINSTTPPDIPVNNRDVLTVMANGSLTFVNVSVEYTNNYTVEMTKSGQGTASATFTLKVFEHIENVTVDLQPDFASEGADRFTLQYTMLRGVVEEQTWFFKGTEIKNNSHYLVEQRSLVVLKPNRSDTGQYSVVLKNPFSTVTTQKTVTVLYGPDEPILEASPAQQFYISGDSLTLSCKTEGLPQPVLKWVFGGEPVSGSVGGILNLTNVQTNQSGIYNCTAINEKTKLQRQKSMNLKVYEKPEGTPMCSVHSVNNTDLQYDCQWSGGSPQAQLSFPALSNSSSGMGHLSLTVSASDSLDGTPVSCTADHPIEKNECNITASRPAEFLPSMRTTVNSEGKIEVTITCLSEASPKTVVSWSKGNETVSSGSTYQISSNTTQLDIQHYNVSNFLLHNYTCTCRNPLGFQKRGIQLQGPSISDSNLFPNQDGTVVTLTWEVPPTSVVTGFDVQMKGPELQTQSRNDTKTRGSSDVFTTILLKPGSARSADILFLDPDRTYRFRIIPKARSTEGEPSKVHRIRPGDGLSGPAIAGIAAGIPCSLLFLILLGGFIYLCFYCHKNKSQLGRYPKTRAHETVIKNKSDPSPHNLLAGGLKPPPDYNRLHQTPSERSVTLPSFVPPPPVRVATTV